MTPVAAPIANETSCVEQLTARPEVYRYEGQGVVGRTQAVEVVAGQLARIEWTLRDSRGRPLDLTACYAPEAPPALPSSSSSESSSEPSSASETLAQGYFKVRLLEALSSADSIELTAEVVSAAAGIVAAQMTAAIPPGIYRIEWGVLNSAGALLFTNQGFLAVTAGQFGSTRSRGPWSIKEIRLALRDSSPEDNYLLARLEYDLAEICQAIIRPVAWFNETQPPSTRRFSTSTFPFREQWLRGTLAFLYETAAAQYRREHVVHSAGGVALNDKAKAMEYEQKGAQFRQEYLSWVRAKKKQINADQGYGVVGLRGGGWGWRW